jgi:alpha-glutamyl/putrescinyl thymine pyrophosphorylase clade 1
MNEPFQAALAGEPFWLLVACCLADRTSWSEAAPVFHEIRRRYRCPNDLARADDVALSTLADHGLLFQDRYKTIVNLARAWCFGERNPENLPGYAADSWAIFVEDRVVEPEDAVLKAYADRLRRPSGADVALKWISAREALRVARVAGWPRELWTTDSVLKMYRFCNVRREDDRVTQWVDAYIRRPYANHPELFFMLCAARIINWPPTLKTIMDTGAWPSDAGWDSEAFGAVLRRLEASGVKVWTGAYLMGKAEADVPKSTTVVNQLTAARAAVPPGAPFNSLRATHDALAAARGWGPFLAYQVVVDARFTPLLGSAPDLDWAAAGPGTRKGLNLMHGRPEDFSLSQKQALREMRYLEPTLRSVGVDFDFSDIPNIMCETFKYAKALRGGRLRARYSPSADAY